ncbi:energy transducer TonB [Fischerella sp. PCC 9605]|uniref:energy transducer TonB n=1 Tax=Fischerella sp. PCC 9605 TaxID=1173024 RepID=UPI00047E3883|nr:energy transducer TonB [Fischerella sp. PCC 9605]
MAKSHKFECNRSDRPRDLLVYLASSILLHFILFIGSNYWLQAFVAKQKQQLSQEIPIEYVEVLPHETQKPPKTSRRAVKDSVAGGKANLERPVSVAKSASPFAPKPSTSALEITQPKREAPNLFPQKPQPKPLQIAPTSTTPPASKPQKIVVAPQTRPPQPKPLQIAPTSTTPPASKPQKIVVAPQTRTPQPKPLQTAPTPTTPPATKPQKIVVAPQTRPLQPKPLQTAPTPTTPPASKPQKIVVAPQTRTPQPKPLQTAPTPTTPPATKKTGAASRLGGPLSVSSDNFRGDDLAALPNSNRSNQASEGIDARQDIDISSYLDQLRQLVKQQWIPGFSHSSRRTVLHFTVNRSGQVSSLQIAQSSGFSVTDEAALNAIQRSAPFAPLPAGYKSDYIHIQFTFDINVYGELNLSRDGS